MKYVASLEMKNVAVGLGTGFAMSGDSAGRNEVTAFSPHARETSSSDETTKGERVRMVMLRER
jgi:hypothetical protein